ncbi:TolC family protein [uncultured Hyphomonas sp.]|uniref:TolC family protein n=1 Tax=uncultured Hyphomonas sp. TaxID=225298 RepID=UPI002AAB8AEF|nr:TolC family protein [uncultured Hyphomonas sp.]
MSLSFARRLSVSLLALAAPVALAQPISLRDAVQQALSHDPSLERAEAGVERSKAGVAAARAGRGPQAGLQAQVGAVETDFTQDRISQVPRSAGLQAEWTVFQSGALGAAIDAAKAQRDAASHQMLGAREKLVLDTFEAYANAWLAERTVEVAEARVATFRIRLEETQARFDQGQVTRTDIALTEARLASAQAQREAARAALAGAWARLARLTGVDHAVTQESPELGAVVGGDMQVALSRVMSRNPDLAAARAAEISAGHRVTEAKGRFGPTVSLKARATTGEDVYFFFEDQISDVGAFVTVEVPLLTSGLRNASKREAIAGRSAAAADVRAAELQLHEAVVGLWGDIEARRLSLAAAERAEKAAELAAEGAQKEQEAGIRTLVDALDAENAYRDAQIARYRAATQLQVAEARLLSLSSDLEQQLALLP